MTPDQIAENIGCQDAEHVCKLKAKLPGSRRAYTIMRRNCQIRNIEFALTYPEYVHLWLSSGLWQQKGRGHVGLMRIDRTKPYTAGNSMVQVWARLDR